MRFLEDPRLNRLSVILRRFDAGDRTLAGCLELFTTKEKQQGERLLGEKVKHEVIDRSPEWLSKSPLGPMRKDEVKELLINMLSVMNQCYPDYDFSSLKVESFVRLSDFSEVYNNVNYHLGYIIEKVVPGFIQDLWTAVRGVVDLRCVDIYSCSDPFSNDGGLFSFEYFFYDKLQKKILFFSCVTQSKYADGGLLSVDGMDDMDDDDDEYDDDYDDSEDEDDDFNAIMSSSRCLSDEDLSPKDDAP
eukprot:CAMPEP_0113845364 /NCGR_PEP_ID=MMETSP0372-20130328/717_1 /TAXON_ID=340204 /ORGANISM="Lankesteria abbotti" /LENGTH=245 /DNA_ID=CAMNT_0000814401 /DNA_START=209 /DNA_END=946 /DNA_ORIENTATION=+ /assembly_acc=CAM_ASM_000359